MEAIGGMLASAFLQALFTKLLDSEKYLRLDLKEEVDNLKGSLKAIDVIVDDAEKRQGENSIREWLQNLKGELYKARDLLDLVEYELLRRQISPFLKVIPDLINLRRQKFRIRMSKKLINQRERLIELKNDSSASRLKEDDNQDRQSETISTGPKVVFGREEDLKSILELVLSKDFSISNVDFIFIYGQRGIGKTTLAQLVFNHESLVGHFHFKMWVYASYIKDVNALMRAILELITGENNGLERLENILSRVREKLEGKKYLLVLDGMLNEDENFLNFVRDILINVSANGSKVLITTQLRSITKSLTDTHTHELEPLRTQDCEQLIKTYAFYDGKLDAHRDHRIIKMIVNKCNGVPSEANKYGMLMKKTRNEEWQTIFDMDIGSNCDKSQTLPPRARSCLAYCSIFPHNFKYDKELLARQWFALGFVTTEEEARKIFDLLFNSSRFKYSCYDPKSTRQAYVMPENEHRTAQATASGEYYINIAGSSLSITETTRHASFWPTHSRSSNKMSIKSVYKAQGLHALILLNNPAEMVNIRVLKELCSKLQCLRILDLSHTDLRELPRSINKLKLLTYLALSNTKVERLHDSVSELYLLQCLMLQNCYELIELPENISHLTKLRHLNLHLDNEFMQSRLISMPCNMGKLTNLETLSRFSVGTNPHCGISELRDMSKLRGGLIISSLESINNAEDAKEANLAMKEHLQMLEMQWGNGTGDLNIQKDVLANLKPHTNIKELKIAGFSGYSFPSWIGNESFSIVTLKIFGCRYIKTLPPLEQLPSLKKLHLEKLHSWESWSSQISFTCLDELVIRDCINLRQFRPYLRNLKNLEIDLCPNINSLPQLPSLHFLTVKYSGDWILGSLNSLSSPFSLVLSGLSTSTQLWRLRACSKLRHLEVSYCMSVYTLQDDWLPTQLTYLKIEHCPSLQTLPSMLLYHTTLQKLKIVHCKNILSLPIGTKRLICLKYLDLSDSPKLVEWIQSNWERIETLQSVQIDGEEWVSNQASNSEASTSHSR